MQEHTLNENIFVADFWDWCLLIELQGIEATLALYCPLLGGCWCHCLLLMMLFGS